MMTLNESKVNHYCITKGNCADPGGLQSQGIRVRIPLGARISVSCECCALSGRGLCIIGNQQDAAVRSQFYFTAGSLYMFRVLSTPIIRCTSNCIYSLWYRSYCKVQSYFNYKDDNINRFLLIVILYLLHLNLIITVTSYFTV